MRINNNMLAMNTHRQMGITGGNQSKSMEKLSSGLKINRAGDDAAGLSISEKMRGQIRGLNMASKNAQDGISMIQTAEGALNETHAILQRMRELAVQSSSDTNVNELDRESIQKEFTQLKSEIDRIGNTTEFNTQKLIDGSVGAKKAPGVDNAAVLTEGLGKATAAKNAGGTTPVDFNTGTLKIADVTNAIDAVTQNITVDGAKIDFKVTQSGLQATAGDTTGASFATYLQTQINEGIDQYNAKYGTSIEKVSVSADTKKISIESGSTGATSGVAVTVAASAVNNLWEIAGFDLTTPGTLSSAGVDGELTTAGAANWGAVGATDKSTVTIDGKAIEVTWAEVGGDASAAGTDMSTITSKIQKDINDAITAYNKTVPTADKLDSVKVSVQDGSFVIQSGSDEATSSIKFDNSEAAQLLGVAGQSSATQGGGVEFQIGANQGQTMKITVEDMRADALGIADVDLSTGATARDAITTINDAINQVSNQRSELGAFQNRLEHTIKNLDNSAENLQSAESRVRDVDMAKEMMNLTKQNILQQASQAMMAQANSAPQGVLQLLR